MMPFFFHVYDIFLDDSEEYFDDDISGKFGFFFHITVRVYFVLLRKEQQLFWLKNS